MKNIHNNGENEKKKIMLVMLCNEKGEIGLRSHTHPRQQQQRKKHKLQTLREERYHWK